MKDTLRNILHTLSSQYSPENKNAAFFSPAVMPCPDKRVFHTNEEVRRAVLLQEGVQMIPQFGHPVQHPDQVLVGQISLILRLHHLPVQVAHQEAVGWLHIVGEGHHPTMMKSTRKKSKHRPVSEYTKGLVC